MTRQEKTIILTALLVCSIVKPAAAYIGPGIAIALLGYVSWPIAVLAGILSIFVVYPIRYVYRKLVKPAPAPTTDAAQPSQAEDGQKKP